MAILTGALSLMGNLCFLVNIATWASEGEGDCAQQVNKGSIQNLFLGY